MNIIFLLPYLIWIIIILILVERFQKQIGLAILKLVLAFRNIKQQVKGGLDKKQNVTNS